MIGRLTLLAVAVLATASCNRAPAPIRITGSATVAPFTTLVAEAFVKAHPDLPRPAIEASGTGAGVRSFCAGDGSGTPDIVGASRPMRRAEFDTCHTNGVAAIVEVAIGLDGIALAQSTDGTALTLTRKDIFLALAANPMGRPNTAKTWKDVDPRLPATPISVLGPAPASGTRDSFVELLLEPGCFEAMPDARKLLTSGDTAALDRACHQLRTDGPYVVASEDYGATVHRLEADSKAVGVFGYSFLEQNSGHLHGVPIDGITPDSVSIGSGKYPGGRTLYLYVKARHLKERPDLKIFLEQYAAMWGPNGPLTARGLIAMSQGARDRSQVAIQNVEPLSRDSLF